MNERTRGQPVLQRAELKGQRVLLRPLSSADAEVAFPLIHERVPILEWLVWQGPQDVEDLRKRFENWHQSTDHGHSYRFAIVDRETQAFVGTMGLLCVDHLLHVELGYWLAEHVWGRGCGTEAIQLANHLAFGYLKATVVTAEVFVGNHGSCQVLERNGFVRERRVHRALGVPVFGRGYERWFYTLTRGDHARMDAIAEPISAQVDFIRADGAE